MLLKWSASSDAETVVDGYKLYRDGRFIGITQALSFTDPSSGSLPDSTGYQVSAINRANLSSTRSAVVTLGGAPPPDDAGPRPAEGGLSDARRLEVGAADGPGAAGDGSGGKADGSSGCSCSLSARGGRGGPVLLLTALLLGLRWRRRRS